MKTLLPLCLFAAWAITSLGFAVTVSKLEKATTQTAYAIAQTEEAVALSEQIKTERDDSIKLTDRATTQADRAIAQTKEAFALLRECIERNERNIQ